MKFYVKSVLSSTPNDYDGLIKKYGNVLKDFDITKIETNTEKHAEICIDSLDDLLKLSRAVDYELIITASTQPPKITIYDYYIE